MMRKNSAFEAQLGIQESALTDEVQRRDLVRGSGAQSRHGAVVGLEGRRALFDAYFTRKNERMA